MGESTKIEWTRGDDGSSGATWNPIRGCTRVSPGCGGPGPHGGCYAEAIAARFSGPGQPYEGLAEMRAGKPRWTGKMAFVESALTLPLRWRKPRRIFVNSMSDLFHEDVSDEWIDRVFAVMALAPQHTFLVLTKRSGRMRAYMSEAEIDRGGLGERLCKAAYALLGRDPGPAPDWPLPNVWLGVSAEDQERADARVPDLLATPAAVRWVSAEPLLAPIVFRHEWMGWKCAVCSERAGNANACNDCDPCFGAYWRNFIDWIVVGGESGPGARPMHPQWARDIRDQCAAAGVPYFFKQWGMWTPGENLGDQRGLVETATWSDDRWIISRENLADDGGHIDDEPDLYRVGKARSGRLLDGREHNAMPTARP